MPKYHDLKHDFENDPIGWGDETDESGSGRSGGSTGTVEFRYRDAASLGPRDDMLPPDEIKRLLAVHESEHKSLVTKAKDLMAERKALKEGKVTAAAQNRALLGRGGGMEAKYKEHPISAKMNGMRDESPVPANYENKTNEELADKLENRLENRLQNQNRLTMGSPRNTPTLRRT